MKFGPVLLLVLAPLTARAVVDTTSVVDPGGLDTRWSWVGMMNGASAVAIGPNTVLTAKHVNAGAFVLGGRSYAMTSTVAAPKINGTATDLRVVHLATSLPGWYELGFAAAKRSTITMVGYGGAGVVKSSGTGYNLLGGGARRAGTNVLSDRKTWKNRGPVLTSMLDRAGEAVLAGGDSGGGWFADDRLVGISSFVFTKNNRKANFGWAKSAYFGSGAVDLTNAKVRGWIERQMPMDRSFRFEAAPQAVPEPGSVVALGVGAAALLRRRRKA